MADTTTVRGACPHDCPDTCAWEVTVEDGRATAMRGVREHPLTRGGLCAKVSRYIERAYSSERVLHPLRRVGAKGSGTFEQITWEEAIEAVAGRLGAIVDEHGAEAILPYHYLGTQGIVQGGGMSARFFGALGASRLVASICGGSLFAGLKRVQGGPKGMLPEDLRHSRLIVLWGTNTIVTNLHLWPIITEARAAGARVVVIDPVRTRTAAAADWHVRPRPGTDAALALALMHVILRDGLEDADYVERYAEGLDGLREEASRWDPAAAAAVTGVPADEIEELARAWATTRPAAIRTLIGIGHHQHAARTIATIACLPVLTGAWRDHGGGLVGTTAWAAWGPLGLDAVDRPDLVDRSLREVNMVDLGAALETLDPPIRALVVYNSNPAAIAPEQGRVLAGLRREDLFCVVIEQFLTDTALHADIVLPATTQLEHDDLVPSWGSVYLTLNRPAIAPLGEALPNSEIFRRLGTRMGLEASLFAPSDTDLIRIALETATAPVTHGSHGALRASGYVRVALPDPWVPYATGGFGTPSGRFLLDPGFVAADESPAGDPTLAARFPLQLVSAKWSHRFLNSSYANLPGHLDAEGTLPIHLSTDDAAARGIGEGDLVRAFNDRGAVLAHARLDDRVMAGVVAIPSGWWASRTPGGASVNALIAATPTDDGGGVAFHDCLVQVEPVRSDA